MQAVREGANATTLTEEVHEEAWTKLVEHRRQLREDWSRPTKRLMRHVRPRKLMTSQTEYYYDTEDGDRVRGTGAQAMDKRFREVLGAQHTQLGALQPMLDLIQPVTATARDVQIGRSTGCEKP